MIKNYFEKANVYICTPNIQMRLFFIIIVLFLPTISSSAQENLSAERLNIYNNAELMTKGRWQVESGLQFSSTSITFYNRYDLQSPTILQRYGVSNRVELRLRTSVLSNFAINKGAVTTNYNLSGLQAPELGAKINLLQQKKFIPQVSILAQASFSPLASQIYRSNQISPTIRVLMAHTLADKLTVGYNVGAQYNARFYYTYDFYAQKKWGKQVLTNLEYSGTWTKPNEMRDNFNQFVYGSVGYYIDPNVLCDVGIGSGIKNSPDYFFRFGVSFGLKK